MDRLDDYRERARNDPRTTDEVVEAAAAAVIYRNSEDEVLSDAYWKPVRLLHCRADDLVMTAAKRLLTSESSADRALAADILAQVAFGKETRRTEAADLLLPVFERETNCEVLNSMALAFGHIGDERSVPRLVELSSHPDESLRYAVVYGLSGRDHERAIAALIALSSDPDDDVRNWATFGLGSQTTVDTPEVRNALAARLQEDDDEIRGEALVGLAERGDRRVVAPLLRELGSNTPEVLHDWVLIADAASAVVRVATAAGGKEWLPVLERLKALDIGDARSVEMAIARCVSD
jgi:HEAT repeat protein